MTGEMTTAPQETPARFDEVPAAGSVGEDATMALLDRQLAARAGGERKLGLTISMRHREAASLIARRYGYELHLDDVTEPGSVWAEFWPVWA